MPLLFLGSQRAYCVASVVGRKVSVRAVDFAEIELINGAP